MSGSATGSRMLQGAATGAAAGAVAGPWGAAIGGGLGAAGAGLMSLFADGQAEAARKAAEELKKRRDHLSAQEAAFLQKWEETQGQAAPQANLGAPSFIKTGSPEARTLIERIQGPQVSTGEAHQAGPGERIQGARVRRDYIAPAREIGGRTVDRTQLGPANTMDAASMLAARIDRGQADAYRPKQGDAINALEAAAKGQGGPSAAEEMYKRHMIDLANNQFAMAAGARGSGRAALMRQAMQQGGMTQQKALYDFATMRAGEQQDARKALVGALEGARGQDIGLANSQANLEQGANQTNAQLLQGARANNQGALNQFALQQGQMDQARSLANAQMGQQADIANQGAVNERAALAARLAQEANMAEAGYAQQANTFNADTYNKLGMFNAQQRQQMGMANLEAQNRAAIISYQGELQRAVAQGQLTAQQAENEMRRYQEGLMFNSQMQDRYDNRAVQAFFQSLGIKDARDQAAAMNYFRMAGMTNDMYGAAYRGQMGAQAAEDEYFNQGMGALSNAAMVYATMEGQKDKVPNMGVGMAGAHGPRMGKNGEVVTPDGVIIRNPAARQANGATGR